MLKRLRVRGVYSEQGYNDFEVYPSNSTKVAAVAERNDNTYLVGEANKKQGFIFETFDVSQNLTINEVRLYVYVSSFSSAKFDVGVKVLNWEGYKTFEVNGTELVCAVFDSAGSNRFSIPDINDLVGFIRVRDGSLVCDYLVAVVEYEEVFYLEDEINWIRNGEALNEINLNRAGRQIWQNTAFLRDELLRVEHRFKVFKDYLKFLYDQPVIVKAGKYQDGDLAEPFYVLYQGDMYKINVIDFRANEGDVYLLLRLNSGYDEFGFKSGEMVITSAIWEHNTLYWFKIGRYENNGIFYTVRELFDHSVFSDPDLHYLFTDFDKVAYLRLRRIFASYKLLINALFTPGVLAVSPADSQSGNLAIRVDGNRRVIVAPGYAVLPNGEFHFFEGAVFSNLENGNYSVYIQSDDLYRASIKAEKVEVVTFENVLLLANLNVSSDNINVIDKRVFSVFKVHSGLRFLGHHSTDQLKQPIVRGEVRYSGDKIAYAIRDNAPNSWMVLATENMVPIQPFVFGYSGTMTQGDFILRCNNLEFIPITSGVIERIYVLYRNATGKYGFVDLDFKYNIRGDYTALGFMMRRVVSRERENPEEWLLIIRAVRVDGLSENVQVVDLDVPPTTISDLQLVVFVSFYQGVRFEQ